MIMGSLQPRFFKHLIGFPQTDFSSLVQDLYGIEDGIARGLRANSSSSDSKEKKPGLGSRPLDIGTIGMMSPKSPQRPQTPRQFLDTPYSTVQHDQYRPVVPTRPVGPTYLHPPPQPVYATQATQRPPMHFHHQYRAPPPPRSIRQLGMPLRRAFQSFLITKAIRRLRRVVWNPWQRCPNRASRHTIGERRNVGCSKARSLTLVNVFYPDNISG
ncbi:hypothetical protein CK203_055559 [Vitis vinifera]|uniref:Uncharacterized protein n=1 Tax=Vitis vinifera TaxID=29760 RepID=A0A438GXT9_VITVI|nr:hypothetical protein CK203_055559 [Vitis vinifera]